LYFRRDIETTNEDNVDSSVISDESKTDVVTHADEENTTADDTLDHKIAETMTNGEISDAVVCFVIVVLFAIVYFPLGSQTFII
jgi:hypothetical protein